MATKTFTITRTRPDNTILFYPAYVNQNNPTLAANLEAMYTWIRSQTGVISLNVGTEQANVSTFTNTLVYDDAHITDANVVLQASGSIYSSNMDTITSYYQLHNITTEVYET
jgi:hypothetical protein